MREEVVPEVDVAYTDIGIAIRSRESAKDNEEVSRRSDLPIQSEVSKKTKSREHKSSQQLEEEISGPDMAEINEPKDRVAKIEEEIKTERAKEKAEVVQLDAAEAQALE